MNTHYDPDLFSKNNPFCYLGFKNSITLTLDNEILSDITYNVDVSTLMVTLSSLTGLKTYSSETKDLVVSFIDIRNPALVFKTVYSLQFGCCDV